MKSRIWISMFVAITLASCNSQSSKNSTPNSGEVKIACDETMKPVFEAELEVFSSEYGEALVDCNFLPENQALDLLFKDSVQAAICSRQLTAQEMAVFKQKSLYPRHALVAIDAIALIVNKSNRDSLLTVSQVRDILTGKITRWTQLNPKSSNDPIRVVFDNEKSSIVSFCADSICKGKMDVKKLYALNYNRDVIDYVSKHKDVLGFIGVNWISNRNDSLHLSFHNSIRAVAISESVDANSDNSYLPYQAYMVDNLYPFTRNVYFIISEPYNGLATGFSNFVASEKGQRIILKSGILPAIAPTRLVHVRSEL